MLPRSARRSVELLEEFGGSEEESLLILSLAG